MTEKLSWTRETHADDSVVVYHIRGVLGESTGSFELLEEIKSGLKASPRHVVLDLDEVELITSTGIGLVANCMTDAREQERTLAICSAKKAVDRALHLMGYVDLIPRFDSVDAALASLT